MMWRICGLLVAMLWWGNVSETMGLGPSLQTTRADSISLEKIGKDGAPMILVPAGPFLMGVPTWARDGGRDEYPNHEVDLPAYFLDTYEVTNGRYLEFIRETAHRAPKHASDATKDLWQDGLMPESINTLPEINVDWFEAKA